MGGKAIAHHTSLLQSEMMPLVEDDSKPKDGNAEEGKKLDALKKGTSKKMSNKRIVNTGRKVNGEPLSGDLAELNEKFRGDRFKEEDSFHASIPEPKRSELVKANSKMTCPLNDNLDGHLKNNDEFKKNVSESEKQELKELRQSAREITNETVMQKVIPYETVQDYLNQGWSTVRNCCSKAEDTAPYTTNADEVYRNLRLDYAGGGEQYKELAEQGGDIYVMRFTSNICPDNSAIPDTSNGNNPPCTETGILGGSDYLIPETMYPNAQVTDGVIYKVDKDGNESMAAAWNEDSGRFINMG